MNLTGGWTDVARAETVLRRLDGTRQQWWALHAVQHGRAGRLWLGGLLLLLMLADAAIAFHQITLITLFCLWLLATLALLVLWWRLARSQRSLEATGAADRGRVSQSCKAA